MDNGLSANLACGFKITSPAFGPGQATEQEKQRKEGDPYSCDCVNVPPEDSLALSQTRIDNTRESRCLPRPPEIEPCQDHDDCPGGSGLDNIGTAVAHQQLTVKVKNAPHDAVIFINNLENLKRHRIYIDTELFGFAPDDNLNRGLRSSWKLIIVQVRSGYRSECRPYLCLSGRSRCAELQMLIGAVQPRFDRFAKEIDRSGSRKPKNKRDAEQAGIEMPAPDGPVVEPGLGLRQGLRCCCHYFLLTVGLELHSKAAKARTRHACPDRAGIVRQRARTIFHSCCRVQAV